MRAKQGFKLFFEITNGFQTQAHKSGGKLHVRGGKYNTTNSKIAFHYIKHILF